MTLEDVHSSYLPKQKNICLSVSRRPPVGNPSRKMAPWSSYDAFLVAAFVQRGSKQGIFLEAKLAVVFRHRVLVMFFWSVCSWLLGKSSRAWTNQKWMDMMIWDDVKKSVFFLKKKSSFSKPRFQKFCKHVMIRINLSETVDSCKPAGKRLSVI